MPFISFDEPTSKGGFVDFDAPEKPAEQRAGILGTLAGGIKGTMRAVGGAIDVAQGDNEELGASVREQQAERKDPRLEAFMSEIAAWKKGQDDAGTKPDWIDTAKALGSAAWNNPAGAGLMIAEQLPNSAVSMGAGYGGMKAGGILGGAVAGPPGAAAGAVIGGIAGLFAANTTLETGNKAIEARQAGPLSDEQRMDVMGQGARKGAVITGIDAATLGLTNVIGKATTRAVESATVKTLSDAGINIADKAAVMAARQNPTIVSAVQAAQKTAADATTTLGQRAMRTGGQAALETFGEGAGEYLGEYAASGELDKMEALIEAFSSAGTSAAEIALTKTWGSKATDAAMWGDAPKADVKPAAPLLLGNTPDPLIGFPDGTVGRRSEVEAYVSKLPEDQQVAARAKLMGMGARDAKPEDILAAPDADSAIAAFAASLTGTDMGGIIGQANPLIAPAREMQAQAAADEADLADLAQTETRDLNTLRAQLDQESRKQAELDAIQATGTGQYGIQPEARPAVEQAATVEAPTAMQLAMQRAKAAVIPNEGQPLPMTAPKPVAPTPPASSDNIASAAAAPPIQRQPDILPADIARNDGKPFQTESGARLKQRYSGGIDGSDIIAVEGGFVVRPKAANEGASDGEQKSGLRAGNSRDGASDGQTIDDRRDSIDQRADARVQDAVAGDAQGQARATAAKQPSGELNAPSDKAQQVTPERQEPTAGTAPVIEASPAGQPAEGGAVPAKAQDQRLIPVSKRAPTLMDKMTADAGGPVTFGDITRAEQEAAANETSLVPERETASGWASAPYEERERFLTEAGMKADSEEFKAAIDSSWAGLGQEQRKRLKPVIDTPPAWARPTASKPADPRLVPVSKREAPDANPDATRAKEDLKSAVADLGNILSKNTRATLVPEQEQRIMPTLVRLFDAAARMGYQAFKDAVKYVVQRLRFALGPKVADQISQEELEAAHGQTMFARSGTEQSKQSDEDADDSRESITQAEIPESVDQESTLEKTLEVAKSRVWNKGRDLKVAIQEAVQAAARAAGVDVGAPSDSSTKYLARVGVKDALLALKQNANAVGWYDLKTRQALSVMSLVHPELATDPDARLAFVWAMAVTSNGLKVNKNFEIAEKVYREYKATGSMPNNLGIGTAAGAINDSLDLFNELRTKWGPENLRKFMLSDFTVSEITGVSKALKPGGEHADVTVKGAAILGPKIGNGFFSNLYGNFDSLTMDRWLVRTWGRWTGTLISPMPKQTAKAEARLSAVLGEITSDEAETARLSAALGKPISAGMSTADLSKYVQEASMDPATRKVMNETETGAELRKAGNGLAKYLDGQKEAPAGPTERKYIRKVFGQILSELRKDDQYKDLSMADLQAVLWYAEKRLYESAKQDTAQDDDVDGYSDDDAPDYANAASAVARAAGVSDRRIQNALKKESDRGRTTDARRADGQEGQGRPAEQGSAGGFTGQEKREFITWQALKRIGSDRLNSGQPSWAYEGRSPGDAGLLRRLKDLGVSYIAEWSLGKKAKSVFAANGLKSISLFELAPGDANNAQKFSDAITASKIASPFGAAVYVYPTKSTDSETGYGDMRLFMSKDGKNGVAIKANGDIVSVFSAHQSGNSLSLMQLALAAGGRKLDAFDTVLPSIYSMHGFRVIARTNWNDEFAPDGWDKGRFAKFNGGEPDVVFMAYDPSHGELYKAQDGKAYDDYDRAVAAQQRAVNKVAKDVPKSGPVFARSDQTQTPEFKKWFGDSNMVNPDGTPMVLYHGTNTKFTEFRRSKTGAMGAAVYLGDDRSVAESYDGDGKGKQVIMEVYARGKYLTNMQWTDYINKHGWSGAEAAAKADGWSGVYDTKFENAVAVWDPADIKSATKNNGDFDPANPDIRFGRNNQAGRGVHIDDANAVVAAVREALPTAPTIHIMESVAQAPADLRKFIRAAGAENDVDAAYHQGEIYVFPANIPSIERMQFVLAHHEIRHHGLAAMLGPRKNAVMLKIHESNPKIRALASEQVRRGYAKSRILATEEALADMPVEDLVKLDGFDRIVAAVREWLRGAAARLRRAGLSNIADAIDAKEWTDKDVAALIARAEGVSRGGSARYASEGTVFADDGAMARTGDQTSTAAFKKWFGKSKAVEMVGGTGSRDAVFAPMRLFHTTRNGDLTAFEAGRTTVNSTTFGDVETTRAAIFFTPSVEDSNAYGKLSDGRVVKGAATMPVYLKTENPLDLTEGIKEGVAEALAATGFVSERFVYNSMPHWSMFDDENGKAVVDAARAAGYDSIIFNDVNPITEDTFEAWAVFDPTQIKSAIGNNGDFDATNPDIRFARSAVTGQTARQHTPRQLRAMKNVGFQVEIPTLKERAQALWKDAGKKMAQGIVDQFAPVKDLDKDAYALMRLSKGASGAFESFLHGGKLKLTDNVYDFDETNKGGVVDKLLIPLQGEHHDFMRWVAANRAERLAGEGKENLFSAQDIIDLKTLAEGTLPFDYKIQTGPAAGRVTRDRATAYADSLRVFNGFNKNILDMAEQSGLIDPESRKLWEHEFYVPFYRVADESDGGIRGANIKGGVVRQAAFKQLKGGKNALNADLLDNTLMNWAHLLDASAKNRAAKATIEAAERMGVAAPGNQSTLAQMATSINNKHGVVWFMDGGQKRYSLVDDPFLMTAITSLEYAGMRNPVMNAMSTFKHALTVGVTASPFFKIRNLIRDSVQVLGTSTINPNPLTNVGNGWKLTDPKSDEYFRLLAGGGTIHFGTMLEGSEAKRVQALVESGVDDATILGDQNKVKQFYRRYIEPGITAYNELGNRGEAINRASLYDQLRKQGMSHADASLQARDLMDFSMQGTFTTIRFLTQVVPFLNARLQGLYKLGRGAKENPARFSAVVGAVTVMSVALLAAYGDDDDWKKREEWDRNNFWFFKFGGIAFRIPKPFEIGAIATLAERGFELAFDKEMTATRFRKQVMTLLGDNLSMNPVPQLIKPIIDVYSNKDSFSGRPIETMSMERLKSDYRFTDRTSMTARGLSTGMNAVTGLVGSESLSPVQIDHMLRGYFGWLGSFVVGAGDVVMRPASGQPTRAAPDYWKTITGGMAADLRDAPSRYVSQMYEQANEIERAYGTWRALQKEGKREEAAEFAADNRDLLSKYRQVGNVKRQESRLNERIRMIERSNMDATTKRELIRSIQIQKDRVARAVAA